MLGLNESKKRGIKAALLSLCLIALLLNTIGTEPLRRVSEMFESPFYGLIASFQLLLTPFSHLSSLRDKDHSLGRCSCSGPGSTVASSIFGIFC